jgi:hypothetical protein
MSSEDRLDRSGRRLDSVTDAVMKHMKLTIQDLRWTWLLCDQIEKALTWWQVVRYWIIAGIYPTPPEFWRHTVATSRRQRIRLRVAYAIAIRAQVRWGPLYEDQACRYLGRVQLDPDDQRLIGTPSEWADLWLNRKGLLLRYLGGKMYLACNIGGIPVGQCPSAKTVGMVRANSDEFFYGPVVQLPTAGPVLHSALDWAVLKGSTIRLLRWLNDGKFGGRTLTAPVSLAEFTARQS